MAPVASMDLVKSTKRLGQSFWLQDSSSLIDLGEEPAVFLGESGIAGVAGCLTPSADDIRNRESCQHAVQACFQARDSIDASGIWESLLLKEAALLADSLMPEHIASRGSEGIVGIPLRPDRAFDTEDICACGRHMARRLNRHNIAVRIPASDGGIEAVSVLIEDGISVFVTGLMDRNRLGRTHDQYLDGLSARVHRRLPIDHVQCFAGLDIAGIDSMVDHLLEEAFQHDPRTERKIEFEGLKGRTAVATARLSAAMKSRRLQGPKWNNLLRNGAREMTLVWENITATGRCTPQTYFNSLIGPGTISVLPMEALQELQIDGEMSVSLFQGYSQADSLFAELTRMGIELHREIEHTMDRQLDQALEQWIATLEAITELRAASLLFT
ncbi:MAG: hypothetical protein F4Y37_04960 [Caldilineaceae bacterium SB0664_bin_22]|nr:hypothetical protein [Caldilineaceae bacterium SB0664_bin_22]